MIAYRNFEDLNVKARRSVGGSFWPAVSNHILWLNLTCSWSAAKLLGVNWLLLFVVVRGPDLAERIAIAPEIDERQPPVPGMTIVRQLKGIFGVRSLTICTIHMKDGGAILGKVVVVVLEVRAIVSAD
jgi:hypothetical protein